MSFLAGYHSNTLGMHSLNMSLKSIIPPVIPTPINDNDNDDNDNILFDHNIQIEIIMYNSLENQIIDWSGDYY